MLLTIQVARGSDGRFYAQVPQIAGADGAGASAAEATAQAQACALRLLATEVERGVRLPDISAINFRVVVAEAMSPRISGSQAALGGAIAFGALGAFVVVASQWWISSQLAHESGRSFAIQFGERPLSYLTTWTSVLTMFVAAGALAGGLSAKVRDWIERPLANGEPRA